MTKVDYLVSDWTVASAELDYLDRAPQIIQVDDRAATRKAIIAAVRAEGVEFYERSEWGAEIPSKTVLDPDWNYSKLAIHMAGRNFQCGNGLDQMHDIQKMHMHSKSERYDDIGYHYGVSCSGEVYEGRDIRNKGSHMIEFNSSAIGLVMIENMSEPEDGSDYIALGLTTAKVLGFHHQVFIPEQQKTSVKKLLEVLLRFFPITELGGHQEFKGQNYNAARLCPGRYGMAIVKELREWSKTGAPK